MTQHWYLDIAALRIQEWLARTPDLRLRRGASILLSEQTGKSSWIGRLPEGVSWNDEAGDIDGIVSLVMPSSATEADLAGVGGRVAGALRRAMPALPVHAVAAHAESYLEAHQEIEGRLRDGEVLVNLPAPAAEVVAAKACDWCRSAAASLRRREGELLVEVCTDCAGRDDAAGHPGARDEGRRPRVESRLLAAWTELHGPASLPKTFEALAKLGETSPDDSATHLALVFADGNRLGAVLHALAENGAANKAVVAQAIDDALDAALAAALEVVLPALRPGTTLPVIPHVLGGDDVLVSVPASVAWPFVRTLLATFGTIAMRSLSTANGGPLNPDVSMSAGIVFHHNTHPFADVVTAAGRSLREAKRHFRGEEASIAFLDLTADGMRAPRNRAPLSLRDLDALEAAVSQVRDIPAAARSSILSLVRQGSREDLSRHLAAAQADIWRAAAGAELDEKIPLDEPHLQQLRTVIDLARWWPGWPKPRAGGAA